MFVVFPLCVCVCVCVRACVRACVCVRVRVCVRACVRASKQASSPGVSCRSRFSLSDCLVLFSWPFLCPRLVFIFFISIEFLSYFICDFVCLFNKLFVVWKSCIPCLWLLDRSLTDYDTECWHKIQNMKQVNAVHVQWLSVLCVFCQHTHVVIVVRGSGMQTGGLGLYENHLYTIRLNRKHILLHILLFYYLNIKLIVTLNSIFQLFCSF